MTSLEDIQMYKSQIKRAIENLMETYDSLVNLEDEFLTRIEKQGSKKL